MTAGEIILTADLEDHETTRDFLAHLPMTIKMGRWFNREYAGLLKTPLSGVGERIRDYQNGDVAYYPAGPSLAIYYDKENTSHQGGLIRMGRITSDLALFYGLDVSITMRIERTEI